MHVPCLLRADLAAILGTVGVTLGVFGVLGGRQPPDSKAGWSVADAGL